MTDSDSMVERVARAICVSEKMNDDDVLGGWVHWREAARAAIEAMHNPTNEMIDAGKVHLRSMGGHREWRVGQAFDFMIDAALKS